MGVDLALVWAVIILFGIMMYVIMDGFDLGIGILFPFVADDQDRDVMMNTVAPVWDGNETWLVLGGAGLLAAFPLAYSIILSAFYLPLILMLIGLVFRGVAFEFRFKVETHRWRWSLAFFLGSLLATFSQGLILGAYIQGVPVVDRQFAGGSLDWLTPFSLAVGVGMVAGYALLGATWLTTKTEGDLHDWTRRAALWLLPAVLGAMALVSVWVLFLDTDIPRRWGLSPLNWGRLLPLAPVPIVTGLVAFAAWRAIKDQSRQATPFLLSLVLFLLGFLGLAISLWPNLIPPSISIWAAASPPESQAFLLVGVGPLIPVLLAYTAYTYWVFRGKVGDGYHH